MSQAKYKQYVELMYQNNEELFKEFKRIHDEFCLNPDEWQDEFNEVGKKVQRAMNEWEDKLCRQSEKGGYGYATTTLAEKFRKEVEKDYIKVGEIGIKRSVFEIKKIKL